MKKELKFSYKFWLLSNDSLKSLQNLCACIIIIVPCALYWCKSLWTDVPFHLKIVKTSIFHEAVWLWNFPLFVLLPVYSNFFNFVMILILATPIEKYSILNQNNGWTLFYIDYLNCSCIESNRIITIVSV